MKKLLLSLAAFVAVGASAQQTLVSYPTQGEIKGWDISGSTEKGTVKIDNNTTPIDALRLKNGYKTEGISNGNHIKLSCEGGFKKGDVVSYEGYVNNSDSTKVGRIILLSIDSGGSVTILQDTEENLINSRFSAEHATPVQYTLDAEYAELYLGRGDKIGTESVTTVNVTKITVVRGGSTPVAGIEVSDVVDVEYYNVAGVKVAEPVKGINIVKKTLSNGGVETSKVFVK